MYNENRVSIEKYFKEREKRDDTQGWIIKLII